MKRFIKFAAVGLSAASMLFTFSIFPAFAGGITTNSYYAENDDERTNSFIFVENTKDSYIAYYSDTSPYMMMKASSEERTVEVNGRLYYLNSDGSVKGNQFGESYEEYNSDSKFIWYTDPQTSQIVCNQWRGIEQDGATYWFYFVQMQSSKKGIGGAITNQDKRIAGSWYHFDEEGRMLVNTFVQIDNGDKAYAQKDGDFAVNKWLTIDGDRYYFKYKWIDGHEEQIPVAMTGTQRIDGELYEFDSDGKLIINVASPSQAR